MPRRHGRDERPGAMALDKVSPRMPAGKNAAAPPSGHSVRAETNRKPGPGRIRNRANGCCRWAAATPWRRWRPAGTGERGLGAVALAPLLAVNEDGGRTGNADDRGLLGGVLHARAVGLVVHARVDALGADVGGHLLQVVIGKAGAAFGGLLVEERIDEVRVLLRRLVHHAGGGVGCAGGVVGGGPAVQEAQRPVLHGDLAFVAQAS